MIFRKCPISTSTPPQLACLNKARVRSVVSYRGAAIVAPPPIPGYKSDENAICPGHSWPEYPIYTFSSEKKVLRSFGPWSLVFRGPPTGPGEGGGSSGRPSLKTRPALGPVRLERVLRHQLLVRSSSRVC